jgi:hypothetical protein
VETTPSTKAHLQRLNSKIQTIAAAPQPRGANLNQHNPPFGGAGQNASGIHQNGTLGDQSMTELQAITNNLTDMKNKSIHDDALHMEKHQ